MSDFDENLHLIKLLAVMALAVFALIIFGAKVDQAKNQPPTEEITQTKDWL